MIGTVDKKNRALLDLSLSFDSEGEFLSITAWIDTGFDGHLVVSNTLIRKLQLQSLATTEAILADGSRVVLETYICFVDWFGERHPIQVIANEGQLPLLGTGLLEGRILHVDYQKKQVSLD